MSKNRYSLITGTGKYIPTRRIKNEDFLSQEFFEPDGSRIAKTNEEIIEKFREITTIEERRYITDNLLTSDIAYEAALDAIKTSGINKEELDYIIVAHNFGDVQSQGNRTDIVPSLAARVKYKLGIENPGTVAYDLIFGCPGWLQGVIQADYYIKSGDADKVLVIGADALSRVSDPHDRDSLIYADGAGAAVLEARFSEEPHGIIAHKTRSDTILHSKMLFMGPSYKDDEEIAENLYLKMNGRRLYQYALMNVPQAIKDVLDKCDIPLSKVKKVLIHQANGKMDDAIIERLFKLYGIKEMPKYIMPMSIEWLGNSSVATLPTLLDLIMKDNMEAHELLAGDYIVFASVGAGMNINAMAYRV